MSVQRKNVEFAKVIAYDRYHNLYVYGGNWSPFNRVQGTDCSGCVTDILDAAINGTAMVWTRHGLSTESWRPPTMGGGANPNNGPFGTVMVSDPSKFPANAAVKIAFHHGPGGGANSHTWCQIDNLKVETNGDDGTVLNDGLVYKDSVLDVHTIDGVNGQYGANNWWYLPGPIVEDGTPLVTGPSTPGVSPGRLTEAPDTLYADVSEFQVPVNDSYIAATYSDRGQDWNYRFIAIRSNDGAHQDSHFAANYAWCVRQCEAGNLDGFIVYYFWRVGTVARETHKSMIASAGGPHQMMASMIDVETDRGNNPTGVSSQLNDDYTNLGAWLGNPARVISYGNTSDLNSMWPSRPVGMRIVAAGYGSNPNYPGQIAHQYTDGNGYGGGLPEGVPPFGNCDMNSADGLSPAQFASALGLSSTPAPAPTPPPAPAPTPSPVPAGPPYATGVKPTDEATQVSHLYDQFLIRWPFLGGNTVAEALGAIGAALKIPGYSDPAA